MSKKNVLDHSENSNEYVKVVTKLPEGIDLHSAVKEIHKFRHTLYEVGTY